MTNILHKTARPETFIILALTVIIMVVTVLILIPLSTFAQTDTESFEKSSTPFGFIYSIKTSDDGYYAVSASDTKTGKNIIELYGPQGELVWSEVGILGYGLVFDNLNSLYILASHQDGSEEILKVTASGTVAWRAEQNAIPDASFPSYRYLKPDLPLAVHGNKVYKLSAEYIDGQHIETSLLVISKTTGETLDRQLVSDITEDPLISNLVGAIYSYDQGIVIATPREAIWLDSSVNFISHQKFDFQDTARPYADDVAVDSNGRVYAFDVQDCSNKIRGSEIISVGAGGGTWSHAFPSRDEVCEDGYEKSESAELDVLPIGGVVVDLAANGYAGITSFTSGGHQSFTKDYHNEGSRPYEVSVEPLVGSFVIAWPEFSCSLGGCAFYLNVQALGSGGQILGEVRKLKDLFLADAVVGGSNLHVYGFAYTVYQLPLRAVGLESPTVTPEPVRLPTFAHQIRLIGVSM